MLCPACWARVHADPARGRPLAAATDLQLRQLTLGCLDLGPCHLQQHHTTRSEGAISQQLGACDKMQQ